jgi:transcriptional regulator with PAS, ATPase and Fis domain
MTEELTILDGQDALGSKFVHNVFKIFDHMPIGINFVDENGYIVRINQAMLDYFNLTHATTAGKHISEVEPSSRLPIVLKTQKAEVAHRHRFSDGREAIVHRVPVLDAGKIIGALGIILFGDLQEIYMLAQKNKLLQKKLADYEKDQIVYRTKYCLADIIGSSPSIRACKEQAKRIARSNSNVLITGESGVGKELFAHSIHEESSRRKGPFIRVNCAAIPETLLESELFGYEEGSFTGAKKGGQPGKFELANDGTLFLDEIGDMPYMMQAKILRVLQEREFERVGGTEIRQVNVRVIAATNADLEKLVQSGGFRSDLFYRLNVLSLKIPPLRERREDIASLVYHFQGAIYQENGVYANIATACLDELARYDWPGNIRELRNVVEKIALAAEGRIAQVADIPQYVLHNIDRAKVRQQVQGSSLVAVLKQVEEEEIRRAIDICGGNKIKAAEYLQIPKVRLYRKVKKFGID